MQSDADRFRPREASGPDPHGGQPRDGQPQYEQPQHLQAQYAQPQYARPQYARPQYMQPQPAQPQLARPQLAQPQYDDSLFDTRDAPLIHPAAAQVSSATPYGVPVYQAPGFAVMPQPSRGLSITALVLGLCSVVFAWVFVVVPIIGIVFGFLALKREPSGKAMSVIGLVSSALGLVWVLLFYLLPFLALIGTFVFALGDL